MAIADLAPSDKWRLLTLSVWSKPLQSAFQAGSRYRDGGLRPQIKTLPFASLASLACLASLV